MITVLAQGATHLADNDFGDNLGDGVAGPAGLLIIVLMVVATVFLIRNMNKRLKRLPESFPDPRAQSAEPAKPVTVAQRSAADDSIGASSGADSTDDVPRHESSDG